MFFNIRNLIRFRKHDIKLCTTRSVGNIITSTATNNSGIKWIAGGWVLFLGENLVLSENREWICEKYGENLYHECITH